MYHWKFYQQGDRLQSNLPSIIQQIYMDGFGLKDGRGWTLDSISNRLQKTTLLGLLTDNNQKPCGYAMYSVPDDLLQGTSMLWEDAICLRKTAQILGQGTRVLRLACGMFPGRQFGWLGGRTQNPAVIKRYAKWGSVLPFSSAYDTPDNQLVMNYLRLHIAEVRDVKHVDRVYGICRSVYSEGRLGDYPVDIEGAAEFETKLSSWGFDRDHGDALIAVSKLHSPIQIPATETDE